MPVNLWMHLILCASTTEANIISMQLMINRWDDWVPQDRVRKFTDENKELAAQLHNQMKALTRQAKPARGARGGKPNGSEIGSGRGSEERNTSFAPNSRRGGRQKDYEMEVVSIAPLLYSIYFLSSCGV